jgi:hypothetical protein
VPKLLQLPKIIMILPDRKTRVAIVISITWIIIFLFVFEPRSFAIRHVPFQNFFFIGIFPVFAYWAYQFIKGGKSSKK